ncbi:MAG: AMP-binding protein [Spirochaetales bacterium]|nr:AMP-binding protein [Spirochaetales bacterium]
MNHSWDVLDRYRGDLFEGTWPSILDLLYLTKEKFPKRNGFTVFNPERTTLIWETVWSEVQRLGSYLVETGIKENDKVIINGKNSPAWALSYFAVLWAGAVVVPLDNQMPIDRVHALSEFVGASFVFADAHIIKQLDQEALWVKSLKGIVSLTNPVATAAAYTTLRPKKIVERVKRTENDLAAILFTSGTTGNEKGAMLTHANLVSDVFQACDGIFLQISERDVLYALLPLHHSYSCTSVLLESITHGSECVFGQDIIVSKMINDMKKGEITVIMGIPLLYNKILAGMMKQVKKKGAATYALIRTMMTINGFFKKHLKWNLLRKSFDSLLLSKLGLNHNRICICGAGPLSPKVFKQYQQLGIDFIQGYGLTEAAPILTLNPVSRFKVESVGLVFPLVDMIIADKDGSGVGEVRVKGPNVTSGYYNDPEHTAELFDEEGYLKTGDLGYLDKDNYLYLKGRVKNIIVTEGGKNVYPEEIEDLFQLYDQVDQILVRGYQEDKDLPSELIEAVIYPSSEYFEGKEGDVQKELDRVIAEVNQQLVAYKKITRLTIIDKPMDMTSTKKIKRNKVTV